MPAGVVVERGTSAVAMTPAAADQTVNGVPPWVPLFAGAAVATHADAKRIRWRKSAAASSGDDATSVRLPGAYVEKPPSVTAAALSPVGCVAVSRLSAYASRVRP